MVQRLTCVECGVAVDFPDGFYFQGQLISDWFLFVRGQVCMRHITEDEQWERAVLQSAWEQRARRESAYTSGEDRNIYCQSCELDVPRDRRVLNSGMAQSLILMYRINGMEFAHLASTIGRSRREEAKLAWWGLAEKSNRRRADDSPNAGVWRLTELGRQFVLGNVKVPSHAVEIGGRLQYLDPSNHVTIHDALGTKFNYHDLMNGV